MTVSKVLFVYFLFSSYSTSFAALLFARFDVTVVLSCFPLSERFIT